MLLLLDGGAERRQGLTPGILVLLDVEIRLLAGDIRVRHVERHFVIRLVDHVEKIAHVHELVVVRVDLRDHPRHLGCDIRDLYPHLSVTGPRRDHVMVPKPDDRDPAPRKR